MERPSEKDRSRRPLFSAGTGSCQFVNRGFYTETIDGELVKYDMARLSCAGSLWRLRGTILSSSSLWLHVILYFLLASMVGVIVGLLVEKPDLLSTTRVREAVNYFCLFVSISVAFHVALAVERWWELRNKLLGELWRATNDLNMILAVHFHTLEHRRLKTLVLRYCLLSFELTFMRARHGKADFDELSRRSLLREDERERLEELEFQPQVVWVWIAGVFHRLAETGKMPSSLLITVYDISTRARGAVGGIFAHLDTQLPFSYLHLISVAVHGNNFAVAAKCGTMAAIAIRNLMSHYPGHGVGASVFAGLHGASMGVGTESIAENVQVLLLQVVQLIFVPIATVGLLEVAGMVSEPFGKGFQDFPRSAYHVWLRDECEAFQTAAEEAPKELSRVADAVETKDSVFVHDVICAV